MSNSKYIKVLYNSDTRTTEDITNSSNNSIDVNVSDDGTTDLIVICGNFYAAICSKKLEVLGIYNSEACAQSIIKNIAENALKDCQSYVLPPSNGNIAGLRYLIGSEDRPLLKETNSNNDIANNDFLASNSHVNSPPHTSLTTYKIKASKKHGDNPATTVVKIFKNIADVKSYVDDFTSGKIVIPDDAFVFETVVYTYNDPKENTLYTITIYNYTSIIFL